MATGSIIHDITDVQFSPINSSINTAVDWAILSKFGVEIDLDIVKRMLSLKLKPEGVYFQLYGRHLEKSMWRHNFAVSAPVWMKFCRHMVIHIEKQQILL